MSVPPPFALGLLTKDLAFLIPGTMKTLPLHYLQLSVNQGIIIWMVIGLGCKQQVLAQISEEAWGSKLEVTTLFAQ